jgi:hypothetical protein
MTMFEFLKTEAPAPERGVAALFVEEEPLFRAIPFETRPDAFVPYNRQTALPSTTARAVGESYTASQGTVEPGAEPMKMMGGISPFDNFQVATGDTRRGQESAGFVESVARNYVRDFIKGDDSANPRIMRGLQLRQTDTDVNHLVQSAGAATVLKMLEAKDRGRRMTHWIMGKGLARRWTQAAHDTDVGGYITRGNDEIGKPVTMLADLPIIIVDRDAADSEILPFTEASSTTSMYCVSLRPDMLHGIQVAPPIAEDLGRDPTTGTTWNTVVDWFASLVVRHARAAIRYSGITDALITL